MTTRPRHKLHSVSLVVLAFTWLLWLHGSVADPKFLCVEAQSGVKLESASSGCCGSDVTPVPTPTRTTDDTDCGDCEDLAINLIGTTKRPTDQLTPDITIDSTYMANDAATVAGAFTEPLCGSSRLPRSTVPVHIPVHLRTSGIPLIC